MSKPSKPAAATALEAELRELETQIQRIETVYLSRCGANLVQGEGRQRECVDGSRRRAATPACARDVILPPFLPGWANVVHLAGPAPSVPADNWRSQVRHVAGALSFSAASPPALSESARATARLLRAPFCLFSPPQRVFSLSSVTSPLGDKAPFPPAEKLIPPGRVIIVIHKSHKKKA